jgi:hypothetical protein
MSFPVHILMLTRVLENCVYRSVRNVGKLDDRTPTYSLEKKKSETVEPPPKLTQLLRSAPPSPTKLAK